MIENLGQAISQAQADGFITEEYGRLILDTAKLEYRECRNCPLPNLWREFLEDQGPYPVLTLDLLLKNIAERRIYFREKGWLPPDEPSLINIK
ncbi:MAG: hypothetical protein V1858_02905 [Candidatus Gottesmanbacteria bacterium]